MKQTRSALFRYQLALSLALLILSLAGWAPAALAQDSAPVTITDDQVNAIAKQMFCPVCESTPLDVCPTQACAQWRELIREKLAAGWSEQEIKDYFVEQYGARVLAAPPAQGFNWMVYLVPPVAILAGVFVLLRAMRSWKQPAALDDENAHRDPSAPWAGAAHNQPAAADDEYTRRLEEELRKR